MTISAIATSIALSPASHGHVSGGSSGDSAEGLIGALIIWAVVAVFIFIMLKMQK